MRRFAALAGIILAGLLVGVRADTSPVSHDESFSRDGLFKADVADLKDTQLIAHPSVPLAPDKNVIWCGTLQLAWNEAVALVGEKLHFTTPSPEAGLLNRGNFTRHDLDSASYVAVADFERNHVENEIRAALEKTFRGAASPELIPPIPQNPGPDDFVAYAYLYKNLAFASPFSDETELSFNGQPVKSFGFDSSHSLKSDVRNQVSICDYVSDDDFVIRIKTKSPQDELILAKVAPGATLEQTIQAVLARAPLGQAMEIGVNDTLSVPKLNFDLRRDFAELEGLLLQPTSAAKIKSNLLLKKVEQLVRFQLNEKGAILKSEAVVTMVTGAMAPEYEPPVHHLIFDKPFLLLLKQKSSPQPYFALWIGNTSLLMPDADKQN